MSRTFLAVCAGNPVECFFLPVSHGLTLATTRVRKVTRDKELTSQEEFFFFALEAGPGRRHYDIQLFRRRVQRRGSWYCNVVWKGLKSQAKQDGLIVWIRAVDRRWEITTCLTTSYSC